MRCRSLHGGAHFEAVAAVLEPRIPKLVFPIETQTISESDAAVGYGIFRCACGTGKDNMTFLLCRTPALDGVGRRNAASFPSVAALRRARVSCLSRATSKAEPAVHSAGRQPRTIRDDLGHLHHCHDAAERSAVMNTVGEAHAACSVGGVRITMRSTCPRSPSEPGAF